MVKRKYEQASVTWLNESDKLESNVIYLLTFNDEEKEMYYVGKTSRRLKDRIDRHRPIMNDSNQLIRDIISKLKHFTVSILCKCKTKDELKVKEEYYTLQYRSNEREFGYNIGLGTKDSDETRRMKRDSKIGGVGNFQVKCKSIPDNIIFDSIKQCQEYYTKLYDGFNILYYLDNGKIHKKSGQTFVRIKD